MLKRIILLIAAGGFLTLMASNAMAVGIGAYATVGGGESTFKTHTKDYHPAIPSSSDDLAAGAGLILDTNLAANRIFNYRLKIGGAKYWVDREDKFDMARMNLSNIFGFGIVRTPMVRFWLGPQVGGSYSWGKRGNRMYLGIVKQGALFQMLTNGYVSIFDWSLNVFNDKIKKISYGGVNVGLATGLNVNIGKNFTISFETGFKYNFNWGKQKRSVYPLIPWIEINRFNEKLYVHGWDVYGEVAFMYRVSSDNYARR